MFNLEKSVGRRKDIQDHNSIASCNHCICASMHVIDVKSELKKCVVILRVMGQFFNLPGTLSACVDFCDPIDFSRFRQGAIFVALCVSTMLSAVFFQPALAAQSSVKKTTNASLSGWVSRVLSSNPELQSAQASIDAAEGGVRAADRALFSPELELDLERTDMNTRSAGISQTLDWSNKRGARTAVAKLKRQVIVAKYTALRQRLAADLLSAIAQWNTAKAVAGASEKQVALMDRFVSLAERRRQAGDLSQVDLDLAHLAASTAAFQQSEADTNLIRSNQSIASLTNGTDSIWPAFPDRLPAVDGQHIEPEIFLPEIPSIKMAQARIASARAGVKLNTLQKKADPTIGIRIGKEDSETLAGVTFSIPLFTRNRFKAEVDIANASVVQSAKEAANLRLKVRAEIQATARIYQNTRHTWMAWQTSGAPRLNQRTDTLNKLWQAGELRSTDYLVQLQQTLETEISAIEQRGRMWQAWINWLAASGQIDDWLAGDER